MSEHPPILNETTIDKSRSKPNETTIDNTRSCVLPTGESSRCHTSSSDTYMNPSAASDRQPVTLKNEIQLDSNMLSKLPESKRRRVNESNVPSTVVICQENLSGAAANVSASIATQSQQENTNVSLVLPKVINNPLDSCDSAADSWADKVEEYTIEEAAVKPAEPSAADVHPGTAEQPSPNNVAQEPDDNSIITKKPKRVYQYGNYPAYYGYRFGKDLTEDPRLKVLRSEWFERRRCLDVGCNEGVITVAVAKAFRCVSMLGVDIDEQLVTKAMKHVTRERSKLRPLAKDKAHNKRARAATRQAQQQLEALKHVHFSHANFVEMEAEGNSVDTVLCLSVTKWIHINWGDEGLKIFLNKISHVLCGGGFLVLEPQPWKSYQQTKAKQVVANLSELKLHPDELPTYLTTELKFDLVAQLDVENSASGFGRPIYVFRKKPRREHRTAVP